MKKNVLFSIDETIVKQFNEVAEEKNINKSKLIQKLIMEWIKCNDITSIESKKK